MTPPPPLKVSADELERGGGSDESVRVLALVDRAEGTVFVSSKNAKYTALRPTLEDFVLEMPRGAQVIYPKDLAPICMLADIGPGVRVFETGIGSGALSMTMLRYGADIVGYEIREDFASVVDPPHEEEERRGEGGILFWKGAGVFPAIARTAVGGPERAFQGRPLVWQEVSRTR